MFVLDGMIDHGNLARVIFSMESAFKTEVSSLNWSNGNDMRKRSRVEKF
jgi:hypothetical protein